MEPTRLWPLLALGLTHFMLLGLILAMIGAAFSQAMSLGGSGQRGSPVGALFVLLLLFGVFVAAPAYIAFTSGHRHAVVRLVAGVVVYGLTLYFAASVMMNARDELLLALPVIAAGPMLAVILPEGGTFWKMARITVPGAVGSLVVSAAAVASDTREISVNMWGLVLMSSFAAGLMALWLTELFRSTDRYE